VSRERKSPAATLRARGLAPRRALGQNFLSDPAILDSIAAAAALAPDDVVLEVGPGTGLLTRVLAARAGRVVAVELDRGLAAACRQAFADAPTVTVVEADALADGAPSPALREALATARGERAWKLVANLPYQIAAPLLVGLFADAAPPSLAVVTIQREMADRLRAAPATAAYGALSVQFQLRATAEVVRHLPPGAFWPRPQVRSTVLRCRPRPASVAPTGRFPAVLRALFDHRRKQVPAALATAGLCDRAAAARALRAMGRAPTVRGEALAPAEIVALAAALASPASP
jgi:16S rRNA (adenine1518-N6/adenine1519-N6)-dimethyltransferase